MRARGLLVLLLLLAASPPAQASVEDRPLSLVLVLDEAAAPRTTFDGVESVGAASTTGEAFNRMQRALLARQATGATHELTLTVTRGGSMLDLVATWTEAGAPLGLDLNVGFLVVEDGVVVDGEPRRFLLRERVTEVQVSADSFAASVPLDAAWNLDRLGVIATIAAAEDGARRVEGEILQSALWLAGQDGPTVQRKKAVLVEHASARGCASCVASDEALSLLASQNGLRAEAEPTRTYLSAPSARAFAGLAAGALVGVALAWRRA